MHCDRHWVLTVPPQREIKAAEALRTLGFDAWTPIEYRYRRTNRRSKRRVASPYVLLNRYVILAAPSIPWLTLDHLRDRGLATGYLGVDGIPAALPSQQAAALRTLGDHVPPTQVRVNGSITAGERVMIVDGPFAGHVVKAERIKGGKAAAFVEWLGKTHEVHFPLERLVAA